MLNICVSSCVDGFEINIYNLKSIQKYISIHKAPRLQLFNLITFLTLGCYESDKHSIEIIFQILSFGRFPGWPYVVPYMLYCDFGMRQGALAPSQPCDHKDEQPIDLQPFFTQTIILFFTFSSVVNKLHKIVNILL